MMRVVRFEANDGTEFKSEGEALARDKLLSLAEWYEKNKLYGSCDGCRIEWDDLLEWCKDNKKELKEILSAC
jgi:hypothetical protein